MRFLAVFFIFIAAAGAAPGGELVFKVVCNNVPFDTRIATSWGTACVVEGLEKTILFDTGGDGSVLLSNMRQMGVDPKDVEAVVLSHMHGDHTGGLHHFLDVNPTVDVFVPSSFPPGFKEGVEAVGARVIGVTGPAEICGGAHSTGELGASAKEQALVVESGRGMIVLTGCSHPGVDVITARALSLFGGPIHLVTGGFHMSGCSRGEIERVIGALKGFGVLRIGPSHCTGETAARMFREAWGDRFVEAGAGAVILVDD